MSAQYKAVHGRLREMDLLVNYVQSYQDYRKFPEQFFAGAIPHLVVIGPPGVGKTEAFKQLAVFSEYAYVNSRMSAAGLYDWANEHRNKSLIIDDVDDMLRDRHIVSMLKALMDTRKPVHVSWQTRGLTTAPASFTTASPVVIVMNDVPRKLTPDQRALMDRAHVVVFDPSPAAAHAYISSWFSDKYGDEGREILEFIGNNLTGFRSASARIYERAVVSKRAGLDWKLHILEWSENPDPVDPAYDKDRLAQVAWVLENVTDKTKQPEAWERRTGMKRSSWFNKLNLYKKYVTSTMADIATMYMDANV